MMVRFVMRKRNYNYSVSSNNANSEQAMVDVDVPASVQRMLQDGYILERIETIKDGTDAISNVNILQYLFMSKMNLIFLISKNT